MKPMLLLAIGALWAGACAPALAELPAKPAAKVFQNYEPRPAIWLISDADTKIYLFGTIHMLPPGFKWRSAALERVVKEAGELVVETYDPPEAAEESDAKFMEYVILKEPVPILGRVPAERRQALSAAIEKSGLNVEVVSQLRTWAAAIMLGLSQMLQGWGVEGPDEAPGVEDALEEDFRKARKPILSVERPEVGLEVLNALSEKEQVSLLVDTLEDKPSLAGPSDGEDDRLWAMGRFEEEYAKFVEEMPSVLFDGLVRKRNAAWTEWLIDRMSKPGVVLFAVGAGHLAGDVSVQQMLEKRGQKVQRFD